MIAIVAVISFIAGIFVGAVWMIWLHAPLRRGAVVPLAATAPEASWEEKQW